MQEINKELLKRSAAGMRLIAQMSIYNSGDFTRLRAFIAQNYHATALQAESVASWLARFRLLRGVAGRMRVRQVIGTDDHHVVVLMEVERGDGLYLQDLTVESEYPHRITAFDHRLLDS